MANAKTEIQIGYNFALRVRGPVLKQNVAVIEVELEGLFKNMIFRWDAQRKIYTGMLRK